MASPEELLDQKLSSFLKVLVKRLPSLEGNKKEVQMIIMLILHGHSIFRNDASFFETLRGQVRKSTLHDQSRNATLSSKQRIISLIFLVVLPYFNDKLLHQTRYGNIDFIKTFTKGVNFGYETLHSLDAIKHGSLMQHVGQLKTTNTSYQQLIKLNDPKHGQYQTNGPFKIMQSVAAKTSNLIQLGIALELYRIYSIQLWSNELKRKTKESHQTNIHRFWVPPPPPPIKILQQEKDKFRFCPICENKPKSELCATCGYLVCEDCIKKEICPITSKPTKRRALKNEIQDHCLSDYLKWIVNL